MTFNSRMYIDLNKPLIDVFMTLVASLYKIILVDSRLFFIPFIDVMDRRGGMTAYTVSGILRTERYCLAVDRLVVGLDRFKALFRDLELFHQWNVRVAVLGAELYDLLRRTRGLGTQTMSNVLICLGHAFSLMAVQATAECLFELDPAFFDPCEYRVEVTVLTIRLCCLQFIGVFFLDAVNALVVYIDYLFV